MMARSSLTRLLGTRFFQRVKYSTNVPPELIAFMENKNMVVCWHPEEHFPYEYTKPLPKVENTDKSVLKISSKEISETLSKMKPEFVVEKLSAVTYTTKHIWYPRKRDKRAKNTKPDRPYL